MKRILSSLLAMVMILSMTGCANPFLTESNNSLINWLPWVRKDYTAPICDQTRADVCKQFPALYSIMPQAKIFFLTAIYSGQIKKSKALKFIDAAIEISTTPGMSTGNMWRFVVGDKAEDIMFATAMAEVLGFDMSLAMDSTYVPDSESLITITTLLKELRNYVFVNTVEKE